MKYDIKPGVRGLIFDLDGTLIDSMPLHFKTWEKACQKFGGHIDRKFLSTVTGSPGILIAAALIKKNRLDSMVTPQEFLKIKITEFDKVLHEVKVIEPVAAIVKKHYGILPMAVGTGGPRDAVDRTLEITGLKNYFNFIVTAEDVESHKPHPETFLKCAELMNLEPKYIEVFEDGDLGIKAAVTAGMIVTNVTTWYIPEW